MTKENYLLKLSLLNLVRAYNIEIKGGHNKPIKELIRNEETNNCLKTALANELVSLLSDMLVEPQEITPNIELDQDHAEDNYQVFKSLTNLLGVSINEILYFRKLESEEQLEDLCYYLIKWKNKNYLAIFEKNCNRFFLTDEDFAEQKYNNMLSVESIEICGILAKTKNL